MAVSISAMFKLVDQMSDRMEKIGGSGDKAMAKIEKSAAKADQAFTKSQSSVNKLSAVYKNFEGNAEQLANAVQRGEKVLSSMEKTEGEKRTVPPLCRTWCASGAQCSPARRQNPCAASFPATSSQGTPATLNETIGA